MLVSYVIIFYLYSLVYVYLARYFLFSAEYRNINFHSKRPSVYKCNAEACSIISIPVSCVENDFYFRCTFILWFIC